MICANNQVHYGLMVIYSYLHITLPHYHHYAHLSEGNKLLRCFSDIFCLECVSMIRSVLSIIFHAIYGAVDLKQVALNNSRKIIIQMQSTLHVVIVLTKIILVEWKLLQFGAKNYGWQCRHAWVGPVAPHMHGGVANHCFWHQHVVHSNSINHRTQNCMGTPCNWK